MFHSPELPDDLPEEKLRTLVEQIEGECHKLGLVLIAVNVNVDSDDEECDDPMHDHDKKNHQLMMAFQIVDRAWSKDVQDPKAAEFDLEFKKIESGNLKDQVTDILSQYEAKDDEEE